MIDWLFNFAFKIGRHLYLKNKPNVVELLVVLLKKVDLNYILTLFDVIYILKVRSNIQD